MHVDYIIVGQGISGTFLSWYLQKGGQRVIVIDNDEPGSPSRVSAGIINPVTGRRMVTVWKADEVIPFSWNAYQEMGNELGISAITQNNIIDFFPNPFMRENFLKRRDEGNSFIRDCDPSRLLPFFNFEFGCGEVSPVYRVHMESLLPQWRQRLKISDSLLSENFDISLLEHQANEVKYKSIRAGKIIFCDGTTGINNPFFSRLPFAPNKGEALIIEAPGIPGQNIYKKSFLLTPMHQAGKDIFWVGSNYKWDFNDPGPTIEFRKATELSLSSWLKIPFKVMDHLAGVRPATLERRPFVGFHPVNKNIGILNGMGTKGCSLAPFFAKQLADHLLKDSPISPEADITRFQRILSPNHI
jgi:glycine/D-amino acid oxidase-like deaminating enzyme